MKNKSAKISTDQLFFSHTWNFLNVYLVKQVGRSQATAESYRDFYDVFCHSSSKKRDHYTWHGSQPEMYKKHLR